MLKIEVLIFLLSLIGQPPTSAQTAKPLELPAEARNLLTVKFPDWKYYDCSDEERQFLKQEHPTARPDLISGDFDGNGRPDYAAMITHGVTRVVDGQVLGPDCAIAVFLKQEHGFQLQMIDDPGGDFVMLIHKGDKAYDYELQKEFTFEHDAIDAIIFEKGATSYVYEQGHFRAIITGD